MKKHLIAAAVAAAVAVPAMAQVTVYGIIDMGLSDVSSKTATGVKTDTRTWGAEGQLSGNRIGLRGDEDLGGGLKASFVIEMSHTPSEAANGIGGTNRQSFISLAGGFGTFSLGRFNSLNKVINDSGVFGGASFGTGWTAAINGYQAERVSNTIQYATPTVNGFNGVIQLLDESSDASNLSGEAKTSGRYIGINYNQGPLRVSYANKNVKDEIEAPSASAVATALVNGLGLGAYLRDLSSSDLSALIDGDAVFGTLPERKVKQDSLLVAYNFGVARAVVTYNDQSSKIDGQAKSAKRDDLVVGVSVPMGATTLLAQYGKGDQKTAAGVKTDIKGFQLGALYALSKRTTAYALIGDQETKAKGARSADADGFTVGIRHSF